MLTAEKNKTDKNWKQQKTPDSKITSATVQKDNDIIQAFLTGLKKGKEKAIKEFKEEIMTEYIANIKKAQSVAEGFYHLMNDDGVNCSTAYLMSEGVSDFKLLFLVDSKKYFSKEFHKYYKESIKKRKSLNVDDFYLSIMFIPETKNTDRNKIVADGYTYFYNGKAKK